MGDTYYILKALHLIGMVVWFAGLFYLFRLFVYHVENRDKPDAVAMLKTMERKLYKIITVPGMIATWIFGLGMVMFRPDFFQQPWMHIKLTLVVLLSGYTGYVGSTLRKFARDDIRLSSKACRIINEIPTLFLIAIVFVAVLRYKLL